MANTLDYTYVINALITEISERCDFIYLMGSFGTKNFNNQSDLDFAIFWNQPPDFNQLLKIKMKLEDLFNREVDLINLNKIDIIYAAQVLEKGRLIYLDPSKKGEHLNWKVQKMSEYPDFKFSRKIIEDNILNRKKYVGN